jgi:hypothetical protein
MKHLAFYDVGCEPSRGLLGLKVRLRRRVRNLLLPMFRRLVEILGSLCHRLEVLEKEVEDLRDRVDDLRRRQEEQSAKVPSTLAFGWDYVAMVRRLAILEEHVDVLLTARAAPAIDSKAVNDPAPVRFPIASSLEPEPAPRARVG